MNEASLKEKIAGLLAKAERTDNQHEADAYNAKAESLMLKYGIEQAELQAAGKVKAEDIIEVKIPFTGIYAVIMPGFVNAIAQALGNLSVLQSKSYDGKTYTAFIIGHQTDVDHAVVLINSLHMQAMSSMKRWWKTAPEREWLKGMQAYKARRQFVHSFAGGAAERIRSERVEEQATVSTGAALVLRDKKAAVDEWVNQNHNVGRSRGRVQGGMAGYAEGRAAGRQANVGTTGIGGSRAALNG